MKKLILILIVLLISGVCSAFEFGASYSIRTANEQPNPADYEWAIELIGNHLYWEYQKERLNGQEYINYEMKHKKKWLDIIESRITAINIQSDNTKFLQGDIRYLWKDMTMGAGIRKSDGKYTGNLVMGLDYKIENGRNDLSFNSDLAYNFKQMDINIGLRYTKWITPYFGIYSKVAFKKYDNWNNQFKCGLSLKIS